VTQLVTVTAWLNACKSYTVLNAISELVSYKPSTDVYFQFFISSRAYLSTEPVLVGLIVSGSVKYLC